MEAALLPHSGGRGAALLCPVPAGGVISNAIASERWSVLVFWVLSGGGVKDSETPSGGVSQPFLESSLGAPLEGGNGMHGLIIGLYLCLKVRFY